jgi:hypothetical protein
MKMLGEILENSRIQTVRNTIKQWLVYEHYSREFEAFFLKWTLLNLYYNEVSGEKHEVDRVLEFGRKHESLFNKLKNEAVELVGMECVGRGPSTEPPDSCVKTATLQLREKLGINANVCDTCRSDKRQKCQNVKTVEYEFGCMEALIRILYQVRCNLFHGDKTEREQFQMGRNQLLVQIGDRITAVILNSLVEN